MVGVSTFRHFPKRCKQVVTVQKSWGMIKFRMARGCRETFEEYAHCCFIGLRRRIEAQQPTPWVLQAARNELAPWWARRPIHRASIRRFARRFEGVFCYVRIAHGHVHECNRSKIPALREDFGQARFQYETVLTALRIASIFSNFSGHCLISPHFLDDEDYEVPVWVAWRAYFATRLVRVPAYWALSTMLQSNVQAYEEAFANAPPWRERIDKIFFRGDFAPSWSPCSCDGSTLAPSDSDFAPLETRRPGGSASYARRPCRCRMVRVSRSNWHESPRFVAVNLSFHFPDEIDARFSDIFSSARNSDDWVGMLPDDDLRFVPERSSDDAPLRYRYVLDVDGVSTSTNRALAYLATGSVMLRQTHGIEPWLVGHVTSPGEAELRPYEHFLPLSWDLSNLRDQLRWARANEGECERIAKRARSWFDSWGGHQEYAFEYVYHLMHEARHFVV